YGGELKLDQYMIQSLTFNSNPKEGHEDPYTPLPVKGSVKRRMRKGRIKKTETEMETETLSDLSRTCSESGSSVSDHSEMSVAGEMPGGTVRKPEMEWTLEETEDGRGVVRFHFLDQVAEKDEEEPEGNG
ncbi:hypothetical protein MPER_03621, partial [Moniliophthora perniciosa FA553]